MRTRGLLLGAATLLMTALAGCWGSKDYPPLERQRIGFSNHGSFFPIDASTVHNRPDCETCHGGTATFLEFTCITCHDHEQAHTDSLHVGLDNYAYSATSCFDCHPTGTVTGVDHEQFFPIGPGAVHSRQHCLDCHTDWSDRRIFTCISCHTHSAELMNPAHSGVAGYQFDSAACLSCHPRAEVMTRALHQSFFPIAAGPHSSTACSDCHATPGQYTAFSCTSCHDHSAVVMDPAHAGVSGYQFDSPSCLGCHPDGSVMTPAQHDPFFPIGPTSVHAAQNCADCHDNPADRAAFTCISCHTHGAELMNPAHSGVAGYQFESAACLSCHPRADVMTRAQHQTFFPIASGRHALPCADCHATPGDYSKFECYPCHSCAATTQRHNEVGNFTCVSSECYRCHPTGRGGDD